MKMTSVSKNTVNNIRQILYTELKPKWTERLFLDEIRLGLRFQKLVIQKDFLEQCVRRTICPVEILSIASRVGGGDRRKSRNRKEEKRILEMRIDEKKKDIGEMRRRWEAETRRVNSVVGLSFRGSEKMRVLKAEELRMFWQKEKKRTQDKADRMVEKQNPVRPSSIPVEYRGIIIGDQGLEDKFGQTSPSIAIYGGIVPSNNVIQFLQLPVRMRRYGRIDKHTGQKKTDVYATGRRWDLRDKDDTSRIDNPSDLRKERDREYLERRPCTKIRVDMTKVRATDLPACKDMMMPGPAKIRDELVIQTEIQSYMDTLDEYLHRQCDSKGVIKDSEVLTEEEKAGLDELKDGIENRGWMVYSTDKSGKIVLDTKENFLLCMREHYEKDEIVTPEIVRKGEFNLNNYSRS